MSVADICQNCGLPFERCLHLSQCFVCWFMSWDLHDRDWHDCIGCEQ